MERRRNSFNYGEFTFHGRYHKQIIDLVIGLLRSGTTSYTYTTPTPSKTTSTRTKTTSITLPGSSPTAMPSPPLALWPQSSNQAPGDSTSQVQALETQLRATREQLRRATTVMVRQKEQMATLEQERRELADRVDDLVEENRDLISKRQHCERETEVMRATLYEEKMSFQNQSRPGRSAHNLDRELQAQQLRTTKNDFDPTIAKMTVKAASYSLFAVEECIKIMKDGGIAADIFEHVVTLQKLAIKCHHTRGMPSITASMTELAEVRAKDVAAATTLTHRSTLTKRKRKRAEEETEAEPARFDVQRPAVREASTESNKRARSSITADIAEFRKRYEAGNT